MNHGHLGRELQSVCAALSLCIWLPRGVWTLDSGARAPGGRRPGLEPPQLPELLACKASSPGSPGQPCSLPSSLEADEQTQRSPAQRSLQLALGPQRSPASSRAEQHRGPCPFQGTPWEDCVGDQIPGTPPRQEETTPVG